MKVLSNIIVVFASVIFISVSVSSQTDEPYLEIGKPIERELRGGDRHVFVFENPGHKFVHILANQKGIDVVVTLLAPDGSTVIEVDSPNGANGREPVWAVLGAAGRCTVVIRSLGAADKPGKYDIALVEMADATSDLQHFAAAKKAITEGIAFGLSRTGDGLSKSTEKFNEASRIADLMTSDIPRKAGLLFQLAGYFGTNRLNSASLSHYDRATALYLEAGMKRDAIKAIRASAGRAESQLDFIARNQRVHEFAIELGDQMTEAAALIEEAKGYYELGDFSRGIELTRQGLEIAISIKSDRQAGAAYNNLGSLYTAQANYAAALDAHLKAIAIEIAGAEGKPTPSSILNLGNVYHGLGNYELAIDNFQKAYDEFEKMKAVVGMSYAISNIGSTYLEIGQYDKALDYFLRAQPMKAKFLPNDPTSFYNIAAVYQSTARPGEALKNIDMAIELLNKTGDNNGMARALIIKSDILFSKGNYTEALELANTAVELARKFYYPHHMWSAKVSAAQAQLKLQKPTDAKQSLMESIDSIELLRTHLTPNEGSEGFFEKKSSPYRLLMSMMVDENRPADALAMEERIKARTLLDSLSGGKVEISKSMTPQEIKSETALRYEMASINLQVSRESERAKKDALLSQLKEKRLAFKEFRSRLYAAHPGLRIQRGEVSPLRIEEFAGLIPDLRSALIEFAVDDDKTYAFVITKSTAGKSSFNAFALEVSRKALFEKVEGYRAKLASGDLDFQKASRELYDLLLKPAAGQLARKTNLIIVPDGPLWDLPFQTLQKEKNKYLVEQAAISYAPSLTALKEMSKKAKARKTDAGLELVAFGNPIVDNATSNRVKQGFMSEKLEPLPESERLVNELGKMYGASRSKIFVGDQAREVTAKTESPKHRIVQFATHGMLNNVSPMYSHLVLAKNEKNPDEDGLLEAWEMKDLDLKADMVILSACDTARGRISGGEGVIGMSWAMFIAGTPTTVASQWKVESSSTTELMLEFHRQLLAGKKVSKAEALRQASLKVMKMPGFKHPSYWAGFVIVGDGS